MAEIESIKQAFGSPGGKTQLSKKIVSEMPPHKIYVEPFAGGAAVYFTKGMSERDVLNDIDAEISFAYQFLRDMTPSQFEQLKKKKWRVEANYFRKLRETKPSNPVDRFYKFYYLKKASFMTAGATPNVQNEGRFIAIEHLPNVKERLKRARVHNTSAIKLIERYDSPNTLFYLDPPYPDRAFVGQTFKSYTNSDLFELLRKLKRIKGKFMLSLGPEHTKYMGGFNVKRVKLRRSGATGYGHDNLYQYEIIVTNFKNGKTQATQSKIRRTKRKSRTKTPVKAGVSLKGIK